MKLSPPASSSDLDAAREIARRLNQQRRRDDRSTAPPSVAGDVAPQPMRLTPPPLPPLPPRTATAPPPPEPPARREAARPEPRAAEPPRAAAARPAPVPPGPSPEDDLFSSVPSFAAHAAESKAYEPAAWDPSEVAPDAELTSDADTVVEISEPEDEPLDALAPAATDSSLEVEVDTDAALSPEEIVGGEVEEASPLDQLTDSEPSPFDDALMDEPAVVEEPAGPSWDEIVESCREIASANGAMLIDPAGQVFAARGEWPTPPGPDAIATRLVAKMEAELKNAPTRSISAPFMGLHLTAWRVQLNEGQMTVAFIGRTPVRPDTRPAVDNEIHRGTGA